MQGKHPSARIGALLLRGGRLIDFKANMSRPFGVENCGFHAEERLIKANRTLTEGGTIVVVRSNRRGKISTMSRPCKKCYPAIVKAGIKKMIYVDWEGNIQVEKVKNAAS
jgi:deoxycytidylate deaminase